MYIKNKKYDYVFFDLDGTLVDSIPVMYQVYLNFLNHFGKQGSKKEFEELNGSTIDEIILLFKSRYGLIDKNPPLIDLYKQKISDAYKNDVKPMKEATNILKRLANNGYKLLLVTSATKEIVHNFVLSQKWNKYFYDYVYGNETKNSKPSSEIYELALKKAGTHSHKVLIVEDSSNGIKAAKGINALVVGVTYNQSKKELIQAGADIIISDLKDILTILDI